MKIYIGSDHAGFELKGKLIKFLKELGHEVVDKGAFSFDSQDDYPDFVKLVAESVSTNPGSRGIVLGKSGEGEAICANRVRGVRAAVIYGPSLKTNNLMSWVMFVTRVTGIVELFLTKNLVRVIKLSREHNDSNVLSLGAEFLHDKAARDFVKLWLNTPFSGDERHVRRIEKLDK